VTAGDAHLVLETARLSLRHVRDDDAPFILRLVNDPDWLRYIGDRGVRNLDDAREYIRKGPQQMYARFGLGLYLVERKADGVPLGLCGLLRRDTLPDVDIGFALAPEHRSAGYAHEAAAAVMHYGMVTLRLPRIVAITSQDNAASGSLLEKLGLRYEGLVRLDPQGDELRLFATQTTVTAG
jgi:RimJ/RimL family protein N-acetyltransferase